MLNLSHVSLRRGQRELLHNTSVIFHAGQKIGITGANGVGKSSLFALIRGDIHTDEGDVSLPPGLVIAHVAQEIPATDKSALEYIKDGDLQLRDIERRIAQAEQHNQGEQLAHLHAELDDIQAYDVDSRAASLMHGLGFKPGEEHSPVTSFSGGWRMRLNLAQALMCRSDILLLDEPTNHLDLDAVIWLEDWLLSYPGMLLLISHDRDFLDRVVSHIAHIEQQLITLYSGNYSFFEQARAAKLAEQQSLYEKQQREISHMQQFVDRFRAKATKARQAQSRIKALERMKQISQAHIDSPFSFHFSQPDYLPNPLLRLEHVAAGYAGKTILADVDINIVEGDRIGLLGHNGAGKSTLVKLLAGESVLLKGKRKPAKELNIGYFAQHQLEQLDMQASPLLHLQRLDPQAREQDLRDFLGGFAFHGDMATAKVKPFSGGEKARLVLAMIVYQQPNLLLLDEPTNHLDLEMRLALSLALQEFNGALVVVSHDRHLLRSVSDNLLLVADGQVQEFDGDLDDYRAWLKQQTKQDKLADESDKTVASKKQLRQQAADRRAQLRPLTNRIKQLEKEMDDINQQKNSIHESLADESIYDEANKDKLNQLLLSQGQIDIKLEELEAQWLEAQEELEKIES